MIAFIICSMHRFYFLFFNEGHTQNNIWNDTNKSARMIPQIAAVHRFSHSRAQCRIPLEDWFIHTHRLRNPQWKQDERINSATYSKQRIRTITSAPVKDQHISQKSKESHAVLWCSSGLYSGSDSFYVIYYIWVWFLRTMELNSIYMLMI